MASHRTRRGNPSRWSGRRVCIAVAASLALAAGARGGEYPDRPVRMIVPFPAGGTADLLPRLIADRLSRKWSESVVIDNRPGAGGNIGTELFSHADPDGYTLLATPPGPLTINQDLYPRLEFDPAAFVPVTIIARVPNALLINPRVPADSVDALIALARANVRKLSAATQGNGTTSHLTTELFQSMAGVRFVQVPYRGSAPALQGLVAGDVDLMFDNLGASLPLVRSGQLKLLAVASERRMASLPDIPTVAETLPGFSAATWIAVMAPPKTPDIIVHKLNVDILEVLRDPALEPRLNELSAEPLGFSQTATAKYLLEETQRWHNVIVAAGVTLE